MDNKDRRMTSAKIGTIIGWTLSIILFSVVELMVVFFGAYDCDYWLARWFCDYYGFLSLILYLCSIILSVLIAEKITTRLVSKYTHSKHSNLRAFMFGLIGGGISIACTSIPLIGFQMLLLTIAS